MSKFYYDDGSLTYKLNITLSYDKNNILVITIENDFNISKSKCCKDHLQKMANKYKMNINLNESLHLANYDMIPIKISKSYTILNSAFHNHSNKLYIEHYVDDYIHNAKNFIIELSLEELKYDIEERLYSLNLHIESECKDEDRKYRGSSDITYNKLKEKFESLKKEVEKVKVIE